MRFGNGLQMTYTATTTPNSLRIQFDYSGGFWITVVVRSGSGVVQDSWIADYKRAEEFDDLVLEEEVIEDIRRAVIGLSDQLNLDNFFPPAQAYLPLYTLYSHPSLLLQVVTSNDGHLLLNRIEEAIFVTPGGEELKQRFRSLGLAIHSTSEIVVPTDKPSLHQFRGRASLGGHDVFLFANSNGLLADRQAMDELDVFLTVQETFSFPRPRIPSLISLVINTQGLLIGFTREYVPLLSPSVFSANIIDLLTYSPLDTYSTTPLPGSPEKVVPILPAEYRETWISQLVALTQLLHQHDILLYSIQPGYTIIDPQYNLWVISFGGIGTEDESWGSDDAGGIVSKEEDWRAVQEVARFWVTGTRDVI